MTFVDTSALYAVVAREDPNHTRAAAAFTDVLGSEPVTHNYVVVETAALVQSRLGIDVLRRVLTDLVPAVEVVWVTPELHQAGVTALLAAGRRSVSLVDWVSFEVMRRNGVEAAFAFDDDFAEQGFRLVPE